MGKRHTHIHKYAYINIGSNREVKTYACKEKDCSHYIPTHMLDMKDVLKSICWSCGDVFYINVKTNDKMHPICEHCETGTASPIPRPKKEIVEKEVREMFIPEDRNEETNPDMEKFLRNIGVGKK